jgi:hypothetical protein
VRVLLGGELVLLSQAEPLVLQLVLLHRVLLLLLHHQFVLLLLLLLLHHQLVLLLLLLLHHQLVLLLLLLLLHHQFVLLLLLLLQFVLLLCHARRDHLLLRRRRLHASEHLQPMIKVELRVRDVHVSSGSPRVDHLSVDVGDREQARAHRLVLARRDARCARSRHVCVGCQSKEAPAVRARAARDGAHGERANDE